tara:strand:+ start:6564 stop:7127 length:564 start_codon:yes stop_codon:yes gene_type:complete
MKKINIFSDVAVITPDTFEDSRGFFSETYNRASIKELGIDIDFIQDNQSFSQNVNTLRGIHFQSPPFAQSKLIRVLSGSIFDIFIDLRKDSETYERHGTFTLNPEDGWLFVPKGFAHGFVTLENKTNILYKVDAYFNSDCEYGIKWNDDFFSIEWPVDEKKIIISEKDTNLPLWQDVREKVNSWSWS